MATSGEWVACVGAERDVLLGVVRCPLTGGLIGAARCEACRHLVTRSNDRDGECGIGDAVRTAPGPRRRREADRAT